MRVRLVADVRAASAARAVTADFLADVRAAWDGDDDDVMVVVSELVTNAVQAGASTVGLDLRAVPGCVELRVDDDAPGWPEPGSPGPEAVRGRGLLIVEQLTHSWGVHRSPRGKTVVAAFSVTPVQPEAPLAGEAAATDGGSQTSDGR